MDYSLPGSSIYGIPQVRILEWAVIPFSTGFSWPKDQTQASHIASRFFTVWTTRETSQNQPWAQQKCRSGQIASHDRSKPLVPPIGSGRSWQVLALQCTWLASLRIFKLKSFCFPNPPTQIMWDFISFSCISQKLMWEGTAEKVTYHVRARDCKMQKMRASPLLCH